MVEECLRRAPDVSKAMLGAQYSGAIIENEHALHRKSATTHDQVVSMTRFSAGSVGRRFSNRGAEPVAKRAKISVEPLVPLGPIRRTDMITSFINT